MVRNKEIVCQNIWNCDGSTRFRGGDLLPSRRGIVFIFCPLYLYPKSALSASLKRPTSSSLSIFVSSTAELCRVEQSSLALVTTPSKLLCSVGFCGHSGAAADDECVISQDILVAWISHVMACSCLHIDYSGSSAHLSVETLASAVLSTSFLLSMRLEFVPFP